MRSKNKKRHIREQPIEVRSRGIRKSITSEPHYKDETSILTGVHFWQGDIACAEGAIAAGCRFFAGYPITPASEIAERMARFVEDLDSARERAAITQEELNNRLSEQMNKAMYLLSIIAAIFLPLGLLTGLLGINVGGIPGTESKWAFSIVTVILVGLAIALLVWFKKIKWL